MQNKNNLVITNNDSNDTNKNKVNNIKNTLKNSTSKSKVDNNKNVIPLVKYINADIDKSIIYKENKGKSGVYRLNNLVTGASYVGSSMDLTRRLREYFSPKFIKKEIIKNNSIIYKALLKYGYTKFSLDIFEYCEPSLLISREQYYIDILKPEYNILKIAGSNLGFKHSEITKAQMSINNTGKKAYI